jgi:tRNA(fMet)-specific endonuclease VapC
LIVVAGSYALDTNVVIAFLSGDTGVRQRVSEASAVFLPAVVVGELYFGASKSLRAAENTARIDRLAATLGTLGLDVHVAKHYGSLKASLRAAGRPIPENDIWVAATALRHGLALATRDRHFEALPTLSCAWW